MLGHNVRRRQSRSAKRLALPCSGISQRSQERHRVHRRGTGQSVRYPAITGVTNITNKGGNHIAGQEMLFLISQRKNGRQSHLGIGILQNIADKKPFDGFFELRQCLNGVAADAG